MLKLKTYEDQAKLGVVLAAISLVAALCGAYGVLSRFEFETFFTYYSPNSLRLPLIGAALLGSVLCGAVAFFIGFSTAGQRRNKATNVSWLAFFLSAAGMTLAMSVGIFFFLTRSPLI